MKRVFLPFMMLCLLFVGKAQAQETLTVCDGTATNSYIPVFGLWMDDFTKSEMIYPSEMLDDMVGGDIASLTFYISQPATAAWDGDEFNVYLMEVDATTLTAYLGPGDAQIVYSGTLDGTGTTMSILFDTPYTYEGGNLLVGIEQTAASTWKSCYFYGVETTGASASGYNASSAANASFNQRNFLPKTTFVYEPGDVTCPKPKNLAINNVTGHTADFTWTAGGEETSWLVAAVPAGTDIEDLDPSMAIPVMGTPAYTFTGLDPETEYKAAVAAACTGEFSLPRTISFTTDIACPAPTDLAIVPETTTANVTWNGDAGEYVLCYRPVDMSDVATVILTAPDIWGDGSGYQMLLDADATAYGTIIPETGALTSGGDVPASIYDEFEYKIPENADGSLTTQNMVMNNSIEIQIPAGTYDWCITNPTPGDRMWIAASNGNVGGRQDDYVFEAGQTYEFTISMYGSNDGVDVTIGAKNRTKKTREYEWECIDGITANNYTLEGLTPDTKYQVRVQAVCGGEDGESTWTSGGFTTLPSCLRPTDVTVTNITNHEATVTWTPGESEQQWVVILDGEEFEAATTSYTLTDLDAETDYTVEVVAVCSADEQSQPASATFTTAVACEQPTNIQVAVQGVDATVTWDGTAQEYNLRYREYVAPAGATVTLTAPDVWGDGSGYQMLLDADANTYGSIIPETGPLTSGGDVPASTYNEFEYKIPEEADGALSTSNIVINNSISILIPAGTYDWCITNPTPGDRMWIASSNGNIGGRYDDYVFESGKTYEFTVSMGTQNDQVDLTITGSKATMDDEEWTVITGITGNTYTITGLADTTNYEVQVQAVCGGNDGESVWSEPSVTFVTEIGDGVNEMADGINVWNRAGEIRVDLANGGNYTMNVVNILGQTVMTSNVNGMGSHIVKHNLTTGVYVVTLSSADNTFSTKIVVR